jgi:hypothetical protein
VEDLDGHTMLRHTGGMVSFMSSMAIDIDAGVGVFASINAQQDYRPTPVVKYALQLMRAGIEGRASPAAPAPDVATNVANAAEYVGVFSGPQGRLEFVSQGERLFLLREGKRIALEETDGGRSVLRSRTATRAISCRVRTQASERRRSKRQGEPSSG